MSAIHCSVPDSEKRTLLLAIGTVDGQLFVCIPLQADHEQQIHALSDPPTHDTVKRLANTLAIGDSLKQQSFIALPLLHILVNRGNLGNLFSLYSVLHLHASRHI